MRPAVRLVVRLVVGAWAVVGLAAAPLALRAETIAVCDDGFLESIDGALVLHLAGSPYEMGYQHGVLLKDHIRENLHYLFDVKAKQAEIEVLGIKLTAKDVIQQIAKHERKYIPARYMEELNGLAAGSGLPIEDVMVGNFLPELFHCSGFAVMNEATTDGELYHGRILDYATDWRLQEHAVVIVARPDGLAPFVNITYAGFIGSVTGMNAAHVSIGEMGGRGLGHWDGTPMSFLVLRVLEEAQSLEEALAIFRDSPRTCEYYYVIADGETNEAAGLAAHWNKFEVVRPGEGHPLLPEPVADAVCLSAGDRYLELVRRVKAGHGKLDVDGALDLMDRPVAMKSNLHSVLFAPRSTRFWVAHASVDGQPAVTQPYQEFQLSALLDRAPEPGAPRAGDSANRAAGGR